MRGVTPSTQPDSIDGSVRPEVHTGMDPAPQGSPDAPFVRFLNALGNFVIDSWPHVYRIINAILYGALLFVKELVNGFGMLFKR